MPALPEAGQILRAGHADVARRDRLASDAHVCLRPYHGAVGRSKVGLPAKSALDWRAALILYDQHGWTIARIARDYGCTYGTAWHRLKALGAKRRVSPAWHSAKGRRLYEAWRSMRQRCSNSKSPSYRRYGERGIGICPEWDQFEAFYEWAIQSGYARKKVLRLVDRARDFAPRNCRWVGEKEGRRDRLRPADPRTSDRMVAAFGDVKTMAAWARDRRCTVSKASINRRLLKGIEPEAAITSPARRRADPPLPHKRGPRPRPSVLAVIDWKRVVRMHRVEGRTPGEIAAALGHSRGGISAGLRRHGDLILRKAAATSTPDGHRLYLLWRSLLYRTANPGHSLYRYSGAQGVRVCREWREFRPFYEWAMRTGSRPNLCLVRIERRKGYSPANCRWMTRAELSRDTSERRARGVGAAPR